MNSNHHWKRSALILNFCFVVGLFVGCGGEPEGPARASVSGTVTLDDQPLENGVIRFIPDGETEGPQVSIPVIDGAFQIDDEQGPLIGEHRIEIESNDDGGYAMDDEQAFEKLQEQGVKKIEVVKVPPQYNRRSTLKETVLAEGPNTYEFQLTSKSRR